MKPMQHTQCYFRLRRFLSRLHIERRIRRAPRLHRLLRSIDRRLLRLYPRDVSLRQEFNLWAERGWGDRMQEDHFWFVQEALQPMELGEADQVLDLGCGGGWASRVMRKQLGARGMVVGLDISDQMVAVARASSTTYSSLYFLCASAEHIPCRDEIFTKILSISAFYYFADQKAVLKELARVLRPGGQLLLLTGLYKDLPHWPDAAHSLRVPVTLHSAQEYKAMLQDSGWINVTAKEIVREYGASNANHDHQHDRALLVTAVKQ